MSHRSRLAGFCIDCQTKDLDSAAAFWSAALALPPRPLTPEDAGEPYVPLVDGPHGLHIEVQSVEHASRVHLDIETDDLDAEVARLEALGAERIAFVKRWWVMQAPTGQRFCVVKMHHPQRGVPPTEWTT